MPKSVCKVGPVFLPCTAPGALQSVLLSLHSVRECPEKEEKKCRRGFFLKTEEAQGIGRLDASAPSILGFRDRAWVGRLNPPTPTPFTALALHRPPIDAETPGLPTTASNQEHGSDSAYEPSLGRVIQLVCSLNPEPLLHVIPRFPAAVHCLAVSFFPPIDANARFLMIIHLLLPCSGPELLALQLDLRRHGLT
ncbi:hypothetical protein BC826DRAFT_256981 [Russula brevipes]|nr:hypothetical protein BC826DRAFT_256981 [Russula brevipes]